MGRAPTGTPSQASETLDFFSVVRGEHARAPHNRGAAARPGGVLPRLGGGAGSNPLLGRLPGSWQRCGLQGLSSRRGPPAALPHGALRRPHAWRRVGRPNAAADCPETTPQIGPEPQNPHQMSRAPATLSQEGAPGTPGDSTMVIRDGDWMATSAIQDGSHCHQGRRWLPPWMAMEPIVDGPCQCRQWWLPWPAMTANAPVAGLGCQH